MSKLKKILTKLRKRSIEEAIARCNNFSVYGSVALFPPFFRLINDEKTVRAMEKYGMEKLREGVNRVEDLRAQAKLHAQKKEMNIE